MRDEESRRREPDDPSVEGEYAERAERSRFDEEEEDARPRRRREGDGRSGGRRRSRVRPVPDDVAEADAIEDGHERNIDPREAGAEIYTDHGLDVSGIDSDAIKVLRRLQRYGFQAYLVGGCVRDLLVGQHPKDFDIATSATPKQIKRLFRNSRVIGRRFRLVHIHFGRHILEISTFRSNVVPEGDDDDPLIRRDNVFGTADQDALRRDFTVNALFYDIETNEVIDFVGGMKDIRRHRIEIIGDPVTRLREDPVRMMRAAKFAGRLRFEVAEDLLDAIFDCREDLQKCAAPRVFEELQRLLDRGGAFGAIDVLWETELLDVLLPELSAWLVENEELVDDTGLTGEQRFWNSLKTLDRYVLEGCDVSSVTALSVLFCHLFGKVLHHSGPAPDGEDPSEYDIGVVAEDLLSSLALRLQIPRRDAYRMRQLLVALRRFLSRRATRKKPSPNQLVRKEYFPESLRLFQIYSNACGRWQGEVAKWEKRYEQAMGRPFR
ncbi:MAG: polynucleotide adenylyltransferase PcnB [Planctomycetota bacterium]